VEEIGGKVGLFLRRATETEKNKKVQVQSMTVLLKM